MAADEQRFFGCAGERDPVVAGGVVVMFDREVAEFLCEPLARFQPGVGPGDALRAVCVAGQGAEFFQFGDGAFRIEGHGDAICVGLLG